MPWQREQSTARKARHVLTMASSVSWEPVRSASASARAGMATAITTTTAQHLGMIVDNAGIFRQRCVPSWCVSSLASVCSEGARIQW
ncbi:hypothetical protein C2L64_13480 [Paraburkholderia hospita]|uniref:Uncharacterized protein n=1 Tax=Paraburkholderia hospita TaxID=169430 RepID=A0AAN1J7Z3_9BURK|nr:hypothetical protein C2L64_13480 [Paraburkholderia hospita]